VGRAWARHESGFWVDGFTQSGIFLKRGAKRSSSPFTVFAMGRSCFWNKEMKMRMSQPRARLVVGVLASGVAVALCSPWTVEAGDGVCRKPEVRDDCPSQSCFCDGGDCSAQQTPESYLGASSSLCECVCVVAVLVDCGTECQCYPDGEPGPTSCSGLTECQIDQKGFCNTMAANGVVISPSSCDVEQLECKPCSGPC
jgi:hypothetical protein